MEAVLAHTSLYFFSPYLCCTESTIPCRKQTNDFLTGKYFFCFGTKKTKQKNYSYFGTLQKSQLYVLISPLLYTKMILYVKLKQMLKFIHHLGVFKSIQLRLVG
jgi:hypothetical protein